MPRLFDMHNPAERAAGLVAAVEAIRRGELVGMPTETVYGVAADATSGAAVARIFEAKGRPRFNPLIVHVDHVAVAARHGRFGEDALSLARTFWPGPLTLVVERRADCPIHDLATAGLTTVALRVPANAYARAVIEHAGRPLAAPSANRSGHLSATRAADVAADLGESVALVLDDGATEHGIESTIVACLGGTVRLLRPGVVPRAAIERVIGRPLAKETPEGGPPLSPGRLPSHYAPRARLRLDATAVARGEALLAFGADLPRGAGEVIAVENLSPSGDLREAAANLFFMLRRLDAALQGRGTIAVAPLPSHGLGEAIRDRLSRAAAPRGAAGTS